MFEDLLKPEIQQFIDTNLNVVVSKLALQKNPFPDVEWVNILNQILSKSKSKDKLPTFFNHQNIVYPNKISIEQTSSEITANYKSNLVSGNTLIDLTGGFGVDCLYFSKKINTVFHCETNQNLSEIVAHNFKSLGAKNIHCINQDSFEFLNQKKVKYDWIYIDPSRRNDVSEKVFLLKDCLPNVPKLIYNYFEFSDNILIKTAPILDIKAGINELKFIKSIHIVAVENEVKEILWVLEKNYNKKIKLKTINIKSKGNENFDFKIKSKTKQIQYELPQKYLYEPNSAIMKSNGFEALADAYNLPKLHQNSHLFTSKKLVSFPGRAFEINHFFEINNKNIKTFCSNQKMNLTLRNFPDTTANIRKKYNIKDGGEVYCFFTTDSNNKKIALICTKINALEQTITNNRFYE